MTYTSTIKFYTISHYIRQTTDISTVETDGTAARTVHAPAIYDLTGRAVRLGTTSTDGLPKGIYIVDGRKTVVR